MRSWISLHHPQLSLETFRPNWSDPGTHVVIEHERVCAVSGLAVYNGVRIGMRKAGVYTLCPEADFFYRDFQKEQAALESIALAMMQFTPEVALAEEASLLMDVTASLRLFKGPRNLCQLVRNNVDALGFSVQIGMAPTAQGAWLLARHTRTRQHRVRRVFSMGSMSKRLDALPCTLLPAARSYREWLEGIDCQSLGQMRKLPYAGLQRRSSKDVLDSLDRAYGQAPELLAWIKLPPTFSVWLELPNRIEYAQAVVFAARRLILQMIGWLVAQQLAVSRFTLWLEHERGRTAIAPTSLEIVLSEPAWQESHLLLLLKERLERLELAASVIAIRLEASQVAPMLPPTASLFPDPGGTPANFHRLLELLTARLGDHNVLAPATVEDYRPEVCNEWISAGAMQHVKHSRALSNFPGHAERPFWILENPVALLMRDNRPFYGSPLKLISGPERIECGWWDGSLAVRDYFIAQGNEGARYWLFRERVDNEWRWFLHGLFG